MPRYKKTRPFLQEWDRWVQKEKKLKAKRDGDVVDPFDPIAEEVLSLENEVDEQKALKRLYMAILIRAIEDVQGVNLFYTAYKGKPKEHMYKQEQRQLKDAKRWIQSSSTEPFSFLWVCNEIAIDPHKVYSVLFKNEDFTLGD